MGRAAGGSPVPSDLPKRACRLRIIAVNDVYVLDNLPSLRTLVAREAEGLPRENVITTLAGDFLAPSLLSSLDSGLGMVKVLNRVPVEYVCFGNHEQDIPYPSLVTRIKDFAGVWLNSNMPDFEPELPRSHYRSLTGNDGKPAARSVALGGFCIGGGKFSSLYRENAFGGAAATIEPVLEAAHRVHGLLREEHPHLDEVIPLTHQDMPEDVELAKTGLFPVIIGGHDHELINEVHGPRDSPVVKAGSDCQAAAVIDVEWPEDPKARPAVSVAIKEVSGYEPDADLAKLVQRILRPVRELESATLYVLQKEEALSSLNVSVAPSTMATRLADAVRDTMQTEAAVLNSGAVRGSREYSKSVSFGDLKKECPYPTPMISVPMPFSVLREAVKRSRDPWPVKTPSSLQVDSGVKVDAEGYPTTIHHQQPETERLYTVACDVRVLQRNAVFNEYRKQFPERIPPPDAGRPLLPILVEFFCGLMWTDLLESATSCKVRASSMYRDVQTGVNSEKIAQLRARSIDHFISLIDQDGDGEISPEEISRRVEEFLGHELTSRVIVQQMLSMLDENGDGILTTAELRNGLCRVLNCH